MRARSIVWLATALGGAAVAGTAVWASTRTATARVEPGPVAEKIVARAAVVPSAGVRHVYAGSEGRVLRVLAREGEHVESGDPLAEIEVGTARQTLSAPQDGVVLARNCEVGDWARIAEHASSPLFVLADPAQSELRMEVEEADATKLALDMQATVTPIGAPSERFSGHVSRISEQLQRRSIGIDDARVRADGLIRAATLSFRGERPNWPLGTRAEAVLEVRRKNATARVPRAAVAVKDGRSIVEQPVAFWTREVPVDVLSVDEAFAEIRGLAPGSVVVIPRVAGD
ncbi:MAG TPA: HlyD family efflux transporter periplasmic adaptor subunit [Polyangiales bacterium]|nr:HlyD family efflux transporter periplasmic adaptor subunit [Polyangiales bacterium]